MSSLVLSEISDVICDKNTEMTQNVCESIDDINVNIENAMMKHTNGDELLNVLNDTVMTDQLLNEENDNTKSDKSHEKCHDNDLVIKLRNDCDKLIRECQCLREENRILKNELIKNGIKLETIRGLKRLVKSRDSGTVKVEISDESGDGIKHISALVEFEEYDNDNFESSFDDAKGNDTLNERRSQRKRKMRFNLTNDDESFNTETDVLKVKRIRKLTKCIPKQLSDDKTLDNIDDYDDDNDDKDIEIPKTAQLKVRSKKGKKRPRPKKYLCTWPGCDKRFYSTCHRDSHERVHSNDRPFKCSFEGCDYSSKFKVSLSVHERRHTGEMPYKCPYPNCDFRSRQNANLKSHLHQHTGERPYKCDWPGCDREFSIKSTWEYHKKLHANDKAFACQYPGCERKFICRKDLRNHEAVHTGDRKHKCSWPGCDRSFIQKTNLNNHLLQHANERPFPCDWPGCEWRSLTKHSLMKHKRIHTGERPFPCTRCERRFADESNLRDHIRVVHDKVRKHVCEWKNCGRRFTVRRLLNEHQLKEGHK